MQLSVGRAALEGEFERYARRFDLLELRAEPGKLPRSARLRRWVAEAPAGFVFSVVLPSAVASLEGGGDAEPALEAALSAADVLSAGWLVLQTPPSVTPTTRTRQRLGELLARLPRREGRVIAWEPRGLWEDDDAGALAQKLGVPLVRDVSRGTTRAGALVYARLRALGSAISVRASAIERAAVNLAGASQAAIVIEGRGAARAATLLRELIADSGEDEREGESDLLRDDREEPEVDDAEAEAAAGGEDQDEFDADDVFEDDDELEGDGLDDDDDDDDDDDENDGGRKS